MRHTEQMRLTQFWERMAEVLGPEYSRSWAKDHVLAELGGRTVDQALRDGEDAKEVWRAVVADMQLPPKYR